MSDEVTEKGPETEPSLPPLKLKPGKIDNESLFVKLFHGEPLTHDEIADIFGVSRVAVTNKVKKLELQRANKSPEEFEAALSGELMKKIQLVMNQLSADKINQASLSQLGVLLGILYDKRAQHEKRGLPEISYVGVVHAFDPKNLEQIRSVIAEETAKRLEESRRSAMKELASGEVIEAEITEE